MSNVNVICNFSTIFAQFNTKEEVRDIANAIAAELKAAVVNRVVEIEHPLPKPEGITVTVTPEPAKPEGKAKAKASKAKAEPKPKKETAKAKAKAEDDVIISITDTAAVKKLGLTFEKYTEYYWVLRGETKPIRADLKAQFGAKFNSRLKGGAGWIVRTEKVAECAKALGIKIKTA